ncbi:MAG TPA: DUF1501 domain-containing protein [Pirellulales bacterium]|nr:DUF1501 domain-containing protein [Pirellulales bacterium]
MQNNSSSLSRREFVQGMTAATLASLACDEPRKILGDEVPSGPPAKADACILLWMAGGMAAPETFDPKRYTPFEVGMPSERILCTFPAIDTSVDHIKISQGLEHVAAVMDRATLIRSHVVADLGNILHSRHQYHWHTGYIPPQTVAAPHIGSWIARLLGPRNPALPAFINIGQRLDGVGEAEELKAFTTAGFLGGEFGPFNLPYPSDAVSAVQPPKGMTAERFANRERHFRKLVKQSPLGRLAGDYHQESMLRAIDNAHRLLNSPDRDAFDLTKEPQESYEKYNTGRFGLGCLLARRLIESGARFIEVTTEYVPFLHWDTHENGHTTLVEMKKQIDRPIAQLVLDLEARGLLDRTLVIVASEFSRDMMIEGVPGSTASDQSRARTDVMKEMVHYGLHRHFTGSGSVLLFGGGMKRGYLHGETAPERPLLTTKDPVTIPDLHATILTALGISPKASFMVEKRPFYITEDGKGQPVTGLFA